MEDHLVPDRREPDGRLLSINQAAELLGVSRRTVYRLARRGDLVPSRVGERLRFRTNEIDEYLERNRVRVGAAP